MLAIIPAKRNSYMVLHLQKKVLRILKTVNLLDGDLVIDIGIECRPGFYSASQLKYTNTAPLKVCDLLASSIISLPSFPSLSNDQIKYICSALANLGKKIIFYNER